MNHSLFVAAQVIRKVLILLQRLSNSRYIAVANIPKQPAKNGRSTPSLSTY